MNCWVKQDYSQNDGLFFFLFFFYYFLLSSLNNLAYEWNYCLKKTTMICAEQILFQESLSGFERIKTKFDGLKRSIKMSATAL